MLSDVLFCSIYILLLVLLLDGFTQLLPSSLAIQSTAAIYTRPNLFTSSQTGKCFQKGETVFRSRGRYCEGRERPGLWHIAIYY